VASLLFKAEFPGRDRTPWGPETITPELPRLPGSLAACELQSPPTLFKPPPASELRRTTDPLLFTPIAGNSLDVAEGLEQFTRKVRTIHLVPGMHFPGIDPQLAKRSRETFARELLPSFKKER
jgi:hypothetical protein